MPVTTGIAISVSTVSYKQIISVSLFGFVRRFVRRVPFLPEELGRAGTDA